MANVSTGVGSVIVPQVFAGGLARRKKRKTKKLKQAQVPTHSSAVYKATKGKSL